MEAELKHYRLTGRALEHYLGLDEEMNAVLKTYEAYTAQWPGRSITGLRGFSGIHPAGLSVGEDKAVLEFDGWRLSKEKDSYVPALRTKIGKKRAAELKALPMLPTQATVVERIFGGFRLFRTGAVSERGGFVIRSPRFIGPLGPDKVCMMAYHDDPENPEPPADSGCVRIKASEYHALVEAYGKDKTE